MKSLFRFGILAAITLSVAVTPALSIRAQGNYCPTGLAAADCTLLTDAATGSSTVKTFVLDYTLALKTTGTTSDVALNVKGNGSFDFSKIDLSKASSDPASAGKSVALATTLSADYTMGTTPTQKTNAELRILDGILYAKADAANGGKWIKYDFNKNMASMTGSSSAAGMAQMSKMFDPATISALTSLVTGAVSGTSAAGPSVDGVATTQITLILDAEALVKGFGTPSAAAAIKALAASQGQPIPDAQLTQMQQQITQAVAIFDPTLKATKISFYALVDPAAKQYRGFGFTFSTTVDPQTGAMMGMTSGKPITVDFSLTLALSKLNAPVTVAPVADAVDMSKTGSAGSGSLAATTEATTAQ